MPSKLNTYAWALSLSILLTAFSRAAFSQQATSEVHGTVTDPAGRVLPGATVTLHNVQTNVNQTTTTNSSGYFAFVDITPGQYDMNVSDPGFKTQKLPPFHLVVGQILTENEALSIGKASQTVTVNAASEAVMLEKSSSQLGSVIETKEIQSLPLNGRNFTSLLILSPGVTGVSTAQGSGISTTDAGITAIPGTGFYKPSFFGQQNRETFYLMDGIVNTDLRGAVYGFLPIIDAMQEFRVSSHIDSAQYDVVTGGVVNMLSKSGTSKFHGSMWEFVRNNIFDARNTFTDFCSVGRCAPGTPSSTPAPPGHYTQNQYGGALGGPIFKNKFFFFGAYEGWRYNSPVLSEALVPTPAELGGDFSNVSTSYYQHPFYNPYSTTCSGGTCTVQPFKCDASGAPITPVGGIQSGGTPCMKIPSTMLDPAMLAYLKAYYLPPNALANEPAGYNFIDNRPHIDNSNRYQVRLDFHANNNNFGFFRLSQMWVHDSSPQRGTVDFNISNYHAYNFGGGYTHIFGPNLILDLRGGAMLKPYRFSQAAAPNGFASAASAGFTNLSQYGGMYINLGGPYTTVNAGNEGTLDRGNPVINGGGSITWVHGAHTIKAGADYIYQNRLQRNLYQQFTFSDTTTSNINASKTGNSLASALLGLPDSFTGQTPTFSEVFFSMDLWDAWAQDSWRVTPKLTFNYGVRYDYLPGIHMLDHRLANSLDIFHQRYLIQHPVGACGSTFVDPCIPGGINSVPDSDHIAFAQGDQQVGPPIADNFAPRLGAAFQLNRNTVINGGFGVFYDTITARSQWVQNDIEGPSWPWTIGISHQPVNIRQSNGVWPGGPGNPLTVITGLEGHFPQPVVPPDPWLTAGGSYANAPGYTDQRSLEWNLQIQRELTNNTLVSLGYAGSKSARLDYTGFANAARHASPPGTPPTVVDTLKYMPWMTPGWHYSTNQGYANYNAMLVEFQKRFSNGLNTILSYTWAKSLDNSSGWFNAENGSGGASTVQNFFDPRNAYGLSSYDIQNDLTWSTVYTLPFGKGHRWIKSGALSYLAGGWTANYLFQARSGQPYNLNVSGDVANISGDNGNLSGYSRPNVVAAPKAGACGSTPIGKRGPQGFCEYNPSAFAIPSGSFGDMHRNPFREPYYNNLDFSLVKTTPLHENVNLELRAEGFNVYNAMIMGSPGSTIGNGSAGLANGISSTPRELQFGAKITF